jgi:hypothetical protein
MTDLEFVLTAIALLVPVFALEMLYSEFMPVIREYMQKTGSLTQTGDSSLGPGSVNWLGATAFAGAFLICVLV